MHSQPFVNSDSLKVGLKCIVYYLTAAILAISSIMISKIPHSKGAIAEHIILLASCVALVLGLIGTICPGDIWYGRKNPICLQVSTYNDDGLKTTIWFLIIPLFLVSILVFGVNWLRYLSYVSPEDAVLRKQKNTNDSLCSKLWISWITGGDPNVKLWCVLIIFLPAILICLDGTFNYAFTFVTEAPKWQERAYGLALSSGYAAVVALSFFMIPVAKQSVLLAAFGWSPIQALSLHIWAGRVCFACTMIHGLLFCSVYGFLGVEAGNGFFESVIDALIPSKDCFRLVGLMSFKNAYKFNEGCGGHGSTSMSNATLEALITIAPSASPTTINDEKPCCYGYLRNFTGLISAVALILLTITSLNSIRRWNYRFFYMSHIVTGSIMLVFAIVHFRFIAVYILPSLLYYFCTTSPVMIQMAAKFFLDKGCKLERSTVIGNSNGCAEMVFPKTIACSIVEGRQAAPYVRICVPEISLLWYPFTVATTPHNRDSQLKILFRTYGYFTTHLLKRLKDVRRPPPIVLIDGYYFGPDWVTASMRHDEVLLVAGGIGITPFLSMIRMLHDRIVLLEDCDQVRLRRVCLHWYCRDEGLIRHVVNNHFSYFERACRGNICKSGSGALNEQLFSIQILIHFTGRGVEDTTLFCLEEPMLITSERTNTSSETSNSSNNEPSQDFVRKPLTFFDTSDDKQGQVDHVSLNENIIPNPSSDNSNKDCQHSVSALDTFDDHPAPENNQSSSECISSNALDSIDHSIKREYPNSQGSQMEPARFSLGIQSCRSLLCFSISFIGGLAIHRYYYMNYIVVYREAIVFRAYSTYAVAIWSILVGIIFEIIHRCLRKGHSSHQLLEGDSLMVEEVLCNEPDGFEKSFLPFTGQAGEKLVIHIDIQNGRPLLNDIVDGVVHADLPGAFFCGPSNLLTGIQTRIREDRRALKRICRTNCCIYQEEFEM